jgi:hypothetical protein
VAAGCQQRELFLAEYQERLQRYIVAVEDLERINPCLDAAAFEKYWDQVEAYRLKCQEAAPPFGNTQ